MLRTPCPKSFLFLVLSLSCYLCATAPPSRAADDPRFPLTISSNHRYLSDQAGKPFLIHGDTPWSMFTYWTFEEADEYLQDRHQKGFNTLLVNILDDAWPVRVDGVVPFTKGTDFSTPNEVYFKHIDRVMQRASDLGFLVLADPVYLGSGELGWKDELYENGLATARQFGRFLGQRYGRFQNIWWTNGGDRHPDIGFKEHPQAYRALVNEVALGLKETAPNQFHTVHTSGNASALEQYPYETWLDINNIYTYTPEENGQPHVYVWADREYARTERILPFFLIESVYENDGRKGEHPQMLRRQVFWALLSGACGHLFGNGRLCCGTPAWREQLNLQGSQDMARIKRFFDDLPWYSLVPDIRHKVVTLGYGRYFWADYVTTARTPDGTLALAYLPTPRTVRVDLSQFAGALSAQWWDPSSGRSLPLEGSPFPNSGSRSFTPPNQNFDRSGDFVLVLRTK